MIKVYYGSKFDAVNWKIYSENIDRNLSFFASNSTPNDVANKLCQFSLFDLETSNTKTAYIVDINDWKLTDKSTQQTIRELHALDTEIIFALESSSFKNKLFTELKIEANKCNSVTRKSKEQLIHLFLTQQSIKLDYQVEQTLIDLLPENVDFIKNEIKKLKLLNIDKITQEHVKKLIFNTGDATIFNVIESWLNNDMDQTLERINDLLAANYQISDIVPIFAYSLVQIKFYLSAKLARWSPSEITEKQGLVFWQQNKYANLKPYDKTLDKINDMLSKLYNFDIEIKKQKSIPYSQFIKILFE